MSSTPPHAEPADNWSTIVAAAAAFDATDVIGDASWRGVTGNLMVKSEALSTPHVGR